MTGPATVSPTTPAATPRDPELALGRWRRWWLQRLPRTAVLHLNQHNLYLLPTRAGWMLVLTLLLLLVGSINYQLNLGYLLTFLLTGCAAVSVWVSHRNLRGLSLQMQASAGVFAGQVATLPVLLRNDHPRARYAIALHCLSTQTLTKHGTADEVWADVAAQDSATVHLPCPPLPRGRWLPPPVQAQTLFPLGIFRVWCWWRPGVELLVYPAPEPAPPPLPLGPGHADEEEGPRHQPLPDHATPDGVRPYRVGDPMKWLLWKKLARVPDSPPEQWTSRDFATPSAGELWLEPAQCGLADPEARLARLCAWVLQAEQAGLRYGLRLPGQTLTPDHGTAHRLRCLEALACA